MISKEKYELVKKAIQVHNKLKGRTYLILYKTNAKQTSKFMETPILEENFWHLVGCKIDEQLNFSPQQKHQLYLDCVKGEDISESLNYTRQAQDVSKKVNGVIGYSDESKGMIPKTAQNKSIFKIKKDANDKIFLVISKPYGFEKYDRVDYAISKKIFPAIVEELPAGINYEENLFEL